jgi:hypothetical protein
MQFIRGERFLSCRNSDAHAFQNRDSRQMCYDMLHHGLFTAKLARSHCIGQAKEEEVHDELSQGQADRQPG